MTISSLRRWFALRTLEDKLFLIALLFAIPYFGLSMLFDFINSGPIRYTILDGSLLLICITLMFLFKVVKWRKYIIAGFSLLLAGGFLLSWTFSGGIEGGGAYIFFVLSVLLILINQGIFNRLITIALVGLVVLITSNVLEITGALSYHDLVFDFLLNLFILTILLLVFKKSLDNENRELEDQNRQIEALNEELQWKSQKLASYNQEVNVMKKNLEGIVEQRTEKLSLENQRDVEFAFINAHLVRAPIANIIGILNMSASEETATLRANVSELDTIVRKIGDVLDN